MLSWDIRESAGVCAGTVKENRRQMRRNYMKYGGMQKKHPPMTIDSKKTYAHCTICSPKNQWKLEVMR